MGFLSLLCDSLANVISGGELGRLRVDLARIEETLRTHPAITRATFLQDEIDRLRESKEELTKAVSTLQDRLLDVGTHRGSDDGFPKVSVEEMQTIPQSTRALQRKKEGYRTFAQDYLKATGHLPPSQYRDVVVAASAPAVPLPVEESRPQ